MVKIKAAKGTFEVVHLAASASSASKKYSNAVAGHWHMREDIPEEFRDIVVEDARNVEKAIGKCNLVRPISDGI